MVVVKNRYKLGDEKEGMRDEDDRFRSSVAKQENYCQSGGLWSSVVKN